MGRAFRHRAVADSAECVLPREECDTLKFNIYIDKQKMKVIIAGGRDYHIYETVCDAVKNSGFDIGTVISGGATGVDALGERYAREYNLTCEIHAADWKQFGKAAGPIRNRFMAERADALIAIWDGKSPGTKNMIDTAMKYNLQIYVLRLDILHPDSACNSEFF